MITPGHLLSESLLHAVLTSRVYESARETLLDPAPRLSNRLGVSVLFKRRATKEGRSWTLDFSPLGMPCTSETKFPGTLIIAAGSSWRRRLTPRTGKKCKRWRIWVGTTSGWAVATSPPRGVWTRSLSCCRRRLPAHPAGTRACAAQSGLRTGFPPAAETSESAGQAGSEMV